MELRRSAQPSDRCERIAAARINPSVLLDELRKALALAAINAARFGAHGRYGHRDATMILLAYRQGLRASELCDLQWHQIELNAGRLHVRRSKKGTPSVQSDAGRRNSRPKAPAARAGGIAVRVHQ
jgi:integrase